MPRATAPLVAIVLLLGLALPVGAEEPEVAVTAPAASFASDRVLVGWRDAGQAAHVLEAHGLRSSVPLAAGDASSLPAVVGTNGRPVAAVLAELRADPMVSYAEPDYVIGLDEEPTAPVAVNDPMTADQYSLDRMHVREAWSLSTGASNSIAVLDTGVQFSHPDLSGRLLAGYDFVNGDADAADDNGHGTWVSGIIAARANDGYGIAGISWSDKILPVKIMNANGTGYTSYLVSGIRWAADHGAKVINMSIGGFPYSTSVRDAVDYAWGKGVVLVGAAGNNRREESHYPASYDHVVSVSATQADDEFTNWSSYGPKVDVSAPGASVLTTNCDTAVTATCAYAGRYITISGTSFATPNTAGVVALIRARYPTWTPQQVIARLIATVDDLGYPGWEMRYGWGRVNALRALGGSANALVAAPDDAYESNNTAATAPKVTLAATIQPTIHPAGDVDYFAVDVPRSGRLDVRVTAVTDTSRPVKSALPVDPIVQLLTTSGTSLVVVDNPSDSAATELASVTVVGPTRIIVRVTNWFPNGSRVPYTLRADYVDTAKPLVTGHFPASGAVGLNRFVSPTVTFDEPVAGVTATTVLLRNLATGVPAPATVSYDPASRTARLTVGEQLAPLSTYRLEVTSGLHDVAGNAIAPTSWTFTTGEYGFYDIGSSPFEREISWLALSGITAGCGDGRFCPTAPVTREQMASFLARALDLPASATDYFTDDAASPHQADINRLAASGITAGCAADRFCPTATVTRAQMASFLARALALPATATDYFSDDAGSRHEADINRLAEAGVTAGCSATQFCPGVSVTREQMAAFLERAFGP